MGEGSYAVIFSVSKKDDKEHHELALKKILAKTLTEIDKYTKEFIILDSNSQGTEATTAISDFFKNTGGTYTGTIATNTTYYLWDEGEPGPEPSGDFNLYVGVNGKSRKVTKIYVGVNGKAREVTKIYTGVNGKARKV